MQENTKNSTKNVEGQKLNSFLAYYQIPAKLEGIHKRERATAINGGDISNYGAYCLYDSICL